MKDWAVLSLSPSLFSRVIDRMTVVCINVQTRFLGLFRFIPFPQFWRRSGYFFFRICAMAPSAVSLHGHARHPKTTRRNHRWENKNTLVQEDICLQSLRKCQKNLAIFFIFIRCAEVAAEKEIILQNDIGHSSFASLPLFSFLILLLQHPFLRNRASACSEFV